MTSFIDFFGLSSYLLCGSKNMKISDENQNLWIEKTVSWTTSHWGAKSKRGSLKPYIGVVHFQLLYQSEYGQVL